MKPFGIAATLALFVGGAHLYMYCVLSLKPAYDEIQLGSTTGDVQQVLAQHDVLCGGALPPGKGLSVITGSRCVFQDPWRMYLIQINPQTGRVAAKAAFDKRLAASHAVLVRIIRWVGSLNAGWRRLVTLRAG